MHNFVNIAILVALQYHWQYF